MDNMDMTLGTSHYGLPHPEWRPHQREMVEAVESSVDRWIVVGAPTGCHAAGQGIMMADGTIRIVQDIAVGDQVMGMDGTPRTVLELHRGRDRFVSIEPVKGEPFRVNRRHILSLVRTREYAGERVDTSHTYAGHTDGGIVDVSVEEYLTWSNTQRHLYKLFRVPVDFEGDELPFNPYWLGLFLGDGHMDNAAITTPDVEVVQEIYKIAEQFNLFVRIYDKITYHLSQGQSNRGGRNPLMTILRANGMAACELKSIPHIYLTASRTARLELLAALMDTDGSLSNNTFDFISKSGALSRGVVFLARSLGLRATLAWCKKSDQNGTIGDYARVCISGDTDMIPTRIPRKQATKRLQKKSPLRTGFKVIEEGYDDYFGFTLDGDGRYLMDTFMVTHNSGKTSLPAALASVGHPVVALVATKELQVSNYQNGYDFKVVFGRDNYQCALPELYGKSAAHCKFPANMRDCPNVRECAYYGAREDAIKAEAASLNYAYYLHAREKWPSPHWLVCDEAHGLSQITLEWAGLEMTAQRADKLNLPAIPFMRPSSAGSAFGSSAADPVTRAYDWLSASHKRLEIELARRQVSRLIEDKDAKETFNLKMLLSKFESTLGAMNTSMRDWYVSAGPNTLHDDKGNGEYGIMVRPLTARHFFTSLFGESSRTVMMSATIGDINLFAQELGLDKTGYMHHEVPSIWPPSTRPVHVLDVPPLGNKAPESAWQKQAEEITRVLNGTDRAWTGIIHTNSKMRAADLAKRLARTIYRPIFVPDLQDSTEKQIAKWNKFRDRNSGAICIAWNLHQGYDGTDEKICICAKVPFPNISEPYEQARLETFGHVFQFRAGSGIEQMLGRTRRGNAEDYDSPPVRRGYVAIADGRYTGPVKYTSAYFQASIIKGAGI